MLYDIFLNWTSGLDFTKVKWWSQNQSIDDIMFLSPRCKFHVNGRAKAFYFYVFCTTKSEIKANVSMQRVDNYVGESNWRQPWSWGLSVLLCFLQEDSKNNCLGAFTEEKRNKIVENTPNPLDTIWQYVSKPFLTHDFLQCSKFLFLTLNK